MENSRSTGNEPLPYNEIHRFFDLSIDLLAITANGYFVRLNPAWEQVLGYSLEELLARPAVDFIHPDDLARTQATRQQIVSDGGTLTNFENRYRRKDGSYIWLEWTARRYPGEHHVYGVARDVTARKEAEEKLRQSEQTLRGLLDGVPDTALMTQLDGTILGLNQRQAEFLGKPIDEIVGKNVLDFLNTDEMRQRRNALVERVTALGKPIHFEISLNGRHFENYGSPIYDERGEIVSFVTTSHEVTHIKKTEDALRQSEQTLREFIDALPDGALLVDPQGNLLAFNQHLPVIKDRGSIGQNMFGLLPPDFGNRRRAALDEVLATRKTVRYHDNLDGRHFDQVLAPIFDEAGSVSRIAIFIRDITAIVEADEKLRQNQHTLHSLLDSMPDMVVMLQIDGKVMAANQREIDYLGRPVSDIIGHSIFEVMDEEEFTTGRITAVEKAIANRKTAMFEYEQNGQYYETTVVPVLNQEGDAYAIVVSTHDITLSKRTEAALRKSEEQFRSVLESAAEGILLTNAAGEIILVNQQIEVQFGYTRDELLGKPVDILLPHNQQHVHTLHRQRFIDEPGIRPMGIGRDLSGMRKDASVFPVEVSLSYIRNGDELLLMALVVDISERKQAETALRKSEEQFRSVLESAAEGILVADAGGDIILINREVERQFGFTRDELIGAPVDVLLPEALRATHTHHRKRFTDHPEVRSMGAGRELMGRRKDGSGFPVEVSLSYTRSDELLVMAFIVDISERKQMELERLNHEKLQVEVKKERELIELRQRFMAMISHEFRTPLTAIASSCEILEHYYDRLSHEQRIERVRGLNAHVHTMVSLLDDILMLNKIQAGMTELNPEPLEITSLCHRLLDTAALIDQSAHKLVFTAQEMPPMIQADRRVLEHIFTNLLSNAIKYSPAGTHIDFQLAAQQDRLTFIIQDEGRGIPVEDQPHLFEPFHRARNVQDVNGTGLGLAIVKSNVELHGGSIRFQSAEGQGTTFWVELPIDPQPPL